MHLLARDVYEMFLLYKPTRSSSIPGQNGKLECSSTLTESRTKVMELWAEALAMLEDLRIDVVSDISELSSVFGAAPSDLSDA